jgi:RimJ/RimL family protein N-acetyltransferase
MKILIETERLYLREFVENDYADLCEILQDIDVIYAYEHPFSEEEVKYWYNKNIERYKENGFGFWAVIKKIQTIFWGNAV